MRSALALLALSLATPAVAADHELSAELGTLHNGDPAWDLFSERNGMPSIGLRGGIAVHDRVAVQLGWHRVRRGANVSGAANLRTAFVGHEITLGAKADLALGEALRPYVKLDAMLLRGTMRFDDARNDDDNPGQVSASAIAPGGLAVGGLELRIPQGEAPFTLAWHLEAGYGRTATLDFGDYGALTPAGLVVRSGIGVRF